MKSYFGINSFDDFSSPLHVKWGHTYDDRYLLNQNLGYVI